VTFIDYRTIEWSHVRRTHFWIHQKFHYEYPGPIRELRQRLVVIPADQHGRQQLRDYQLRVSAPTAASSYEIDTFGNRVFRYLIPEIDSDIDFDVWSCIEHDTRAGTPPSVSARIAQRYLRATPLTQCDDRLADAARDLASQSAGPADLAQRINQWTYNAMTYEWGITHVGTTAAEALAFGRGVCQDYAHIMLALCREAGLPARYVSGHLLGEGGSHAWVEALLPNEQGGDYLAVAYDPTNNCLVGPSYITIAVGRDFHDVSPCTGTFIAPFQGNLTVTKRAGLTAVEFVD
jgi:transglutaminase-like putative cysteine protease